MNHNYNLQIVSNHEGHQTIITTTTIKPSIVMFIIVIYTTKLCVYLGVTDERKLMVHHNHNIKNMCSKFVESSTTGSYHGNYVSSSNNGEPKAAVAIYMIEDTKDSSSSWWYNDDDKQDVKGQLYVTNNK